MPLSTTNNHILTALRFFGHQDWVRYGVRYRVISLFCKPNRTRPFCFDINFFGLTYQGNLNSYLDWVVYFYGAYEKQELFLLRDLVSGYSRPVFLDIGANVGHHSLFMSRYCEQVHAFEPYDRVRQRLIHNIKVNNLENVFIHDIGLGEKDQALEFFAPTGSNRGTGSFIATHEAVTNKSVGLLKTVNGDKYINNLQLRKVDLLKIDVEGFERSVLAGLQNTLRTYRPSIVMEWSEDTMRSFVGEEELRSLLPAAYKIKRIVSNQPRWGLFNQPAYTFTDFVFHEVDTNLLIVPEDRQIG